MKIVSGIYGGRPLKTLDGKTTRPTSDKVRGAIFNMIGPYFEGGRVLDLYAGSGGLSIEAISRGMSSAVLVEKDRRAQSIVKENIQMTKESSKFQLLKMELNELWNKWKVSLISSFWTLPMQRNRSYLTLKKWRREIFSQKMSWWSVRPINQ